MSEETKIDGALRFNEGKTKGYARFPFQVIDKLLRDADAAGIDPKDFELFPWETIVPVVKVLVMGAKKYSRNNWRKGFSYAGLFDSFMRHVTSVQQTKESPEKRLDSESKLPHLYHVACNLLFLISHTLNPNQFPLGVDDMGLNDPETK